MNVYGQSQVQTFLNGISSNAYTNPHMLLIKTTIMSDNAANDNLPLAITRFKDLIPAIKKGYMSETIPCVLHIGSQQ